MNDRRHPTILQRLEADSRRRHPQQYLDRYQRQGPTAGPWPDSSAGSPRRVAAHEPRNRLRWQDHVLLTLAGVFLLLLALRSVSAHAQDAAAWGLTLEAGEQARTVLALDTTLHAEVAGLVARVHVLQSFRNDGNDWVEGTYRFPLPDGAAVDRLTIQVGDRVLKGEIRERESAQRVYQQARSEGRTASLVSQERENQFSTRLANIGPGETVHVMIGFLANVEWRDGSFHLALPTTFTPRWGSERQPGSGVSAPHPQLVSLQQGNPHRLHLQVDLEAGVPLATVESLHHDVDIQALASGYQVTLLNPEERPDRTFELRWTPELGLFPESALSTWSDGDEVYAQLMLVPPRDEALRPMSREVVFVIDTSGSMQGASIEQARAALLEALEELQPGDRFNLVQFNSITEPLFAESVPVTERHLAEARAWIRKLHADGGTEMAPALRQALKQPPRQSSGSATGARAHSGNAQAGADGIRQVVFITDGSVGNERELLAEIADRLGDSRLFTVGIGSAPNGWFMRKAAEIGRGHHTHIGRLEDVAHSMSDLWAYIRLPAVSDLCIDWGVDAEYYPEVLPDLYAGQPLWVVARLPEVPEQVQLCGELNGQPWAHAAWPETQQGPETLATLWARRKVESLQDSMMFGADAAVMEQEITTVALAHGLLTPWTSLVAVDRTPARPQGAPLAGVDVPSLLPAGSTQGSAFPATATGWKTQLALSLLVLAVSGGLFLRPFGNVAWLRRGAPDAPGRPPFRSPVSWFRGLLLPRP